MIVNPQLFNYRLIIGSLVIAIIVLGSFSFSSYNTLKTHQEYLEQESKLVQNEVSEMISRYDEVTIENEEISLQLLNSKTKLESILDSLRHVKTNVSLISKYKSQIASLKSERNKLFKLVNAFEEENKGLKDQALRINEKLESQHSYLILLEEKNSSLSETLKEIERLSAINISAKAINTMGYNLIETDRADSVDHIEVCVTLSKNEFTPKGSKDIYVQILDPKGNVVSDKGSVQFDESSLLYSGKTALYYLNEVVEVCMKINVNSKEPLKQGTYYANVYHNDQNLGIKELDLN